MASRPIRSILKFGDRRGGGGGQDAARDLERGPASVPENATEAERGCENETKAEEEGSTGKRSAVVTVAAEIREDDADADAAESEGTGEKAADADKPSKRRPQLVAKTVNGQLREMRVRGGSKRRTRKRGSWRSSARKASELDNSSFDDDSVSSEPRWLPLPSGPPPPGPPPPGPPPRGPPPGSPPWGPPPAFFQIKSHNEDASAKDKAMASIWGITKPSSQPGTSLADTSSESLGSASPPSFKHVRFSTHLPPPTGHQPEFIVINEGRDRGVGRDQDPSPPQIVLQDAAGKGAATAAATARAPKATSATDEATSIAVPATADELGIPSSSRPPDSGRPQPSGSGPASPPVPASQDAEGTPERPGAPPSGVVAELGPPPIPAARVQAGPSPAPRRVRIRAPSTKASSRSSASSSSSSGSTRSHQSLNTRRTLLPHQGAASMFSEGNLSGFYDGLRAAYERSVFRVKDGTSRHEGKKSNGASSIVINLASIHRMYLLTLRYKLVKLALELRYRKPSSGGRKTKQGRDEDDDGSSSSSGSSGSEGGESITRSTEDSDSDDSEDDSDSDSDDPIKSFFDGYPSSALYEYAVALEHWESIKKCALQGHSRDPFIVTTDRADDLELVRGLAQEMRQAAEGNAVETREPADIDDAEIDDIPDGWLYKDEWEGIADKFEEEPCKVEAAHYRLDKVLADLSLLDRIAETAHGKEREEPAPAGGSRWSSSLGSLPKRARSLAACFVTTIDTDGETTDVAAPEKESTPEAEADADTAASGIGSDMSSGGNGSSRRGAGRQRWRRPSWSPSWSPSWARKGAGKRADAQMYGHLGSRNELNKTDALEAFLRRLGMALLGGAFLIGPVLIMVLRPSVATALVTTSVAVTAFGIVVSFLLERPFDVLSGTAAYAAVLVVFVGTNNAPAS